MPGTPAWISCASTARICSAVSTGLIALPLARRYDRRAEATHGAGKSVEESVGNHRMADVELCHVRQGCDGSNVVDRQTMAGRHFEAELVSEVSRRPKCRQKQGFVRICSGAVVARMELDLD